MRHFCRQASHLASERLDRRLTWSEHVRLWLHLAMCGLCRSNVRAMHMMHRVLRAEGCDDDRITLDDARRARIAAALRRGDQAGGETG